MMGFLIAQPPKLSGGARDFIHDHPDEARMVVVTALEAAAALLDADSGRSTAQVPERLQAFVVDRASEDILGVTEAASRLQVSRTTVYDWSKRRKLIAWQATKRGLNIPAAQIVGPDRVVPGLAAVVDAVGDPELAWAFLSQEWPFDETAERPLDRLNAGRLDEVLAAAAGFGATFT